MSDGIVADAAAGVRVSVGVSGAGKTFGIRRSVYRAAASGMPIVVIDRMCEWSKMPSELSRILAGAFTWEHVQAALKKGKRLIIWRPRKSAGYAWAAEAAEQACAWARDYDGVAGVAIPEAHRIAPNRAPLSGALEDCVTAWRHYRVALWVDTQRIAMLSRTVIEQARELRLYAIVGDRDTQVVAGLGGKELAALVREAGAKLAAGEPGWHVPLGLVRVPPYTLTRAT